MSEIIPFPAAAENDEWPELSGMDEQALKRELSGIWEKLALMDFEEPDEDSEEYESWCEQHEELEDMADEIQDRLDALGEE